MQKPSRFINARLLIVLVVAVIAIALVAIWVQKGQGVGTITGTATLGPTCPVEMNPPQKSCADKPYAATFELINPSKGKALKKFTSDTNGHFSVQIAPGTYAIQSAAASAFPRCTGSQLAVVKTNETVTVNVTCDTGIR
jgi:hypothetical protein